jgi:hypothetical protein
MSEPDWRTMAAALSSALDKANDEIARLDSANDELFRIKQKVVIANRDLLRQNADLRVQLRNARSALKAFANDKGPRHTLD